VKKELQNSVLYDDMRRRFDAFIVELVPAEERLAVKIVDIGVIGDGQEVGLDAGADPIGESGVVVVDVFEARIVLFEGQGAAEIFCQGIGNVLVGVPRVVVDSGMVLSVRDETRTGQLLHELSLVLLSERITVRELIGESVHREVTEFNRPRIADAGGRPLVQRRSAEERYVRSGEECAAAQVGSTVTVIGAVISIEPL
jgi:hypothetical protein